MKVLISGGGTGGHIYPGIAIAHEIKKRHPDWTVEFAGRHNSIEGRVVPKAGYVIHNLHVAGYERYYSFWEKLSVIGRLLVSLKDSFVLLNKIKPDVMIGTGGYICGPIVSVAHIKGIPSLISEQNVIPGFTIKTLSKYASVVCTSFEETAKYMHHPERCVLTGNPVRSDFEDISREEARKKLGLDDKVKFILSFGGTWGAQTINDAIAFLIKSYINKENVFIYHLTGNEAYEDYLSALRSENIDLTSASNVIVEPYSNDMPTLLNAADLVISRSGAMTISEINFVGVAAIYSPYPYAVNDHQMKNALLTEENGASIVIPDDQLNGKVLHKKVEDLFSDDEKIKKMSIQSKKLGIKNAAELICDQVDKLLIK